MSGDGGTGEGKGGGLMTLSEVVSRLTKPKKTGKGFNALCPAHDDKSPSLSIFEGDYRTVLHCFAGCSEDAILNAIGLEKADLFPDNDPAIVRLNGNGSKAAAKLANNRGAPAYRNRSEDEPETPTIDAN